MRPWHAHVRYTHNSGIVSKTIFPLKDFTFRIPSILINNSTLYTVFRYQRVFSTNWNFINQLGINLNLCSPKTVSNLGQSSENLNNAMTYDGRKSCAYSAKVQNDKTKMSIRVGKSTMVSTTYSATPFGKKQKYTGSTDT